MRLVALSGTRHPPLFLQFLLDCSVLGIIHHGQRSEASMKPSIQKQTPDRQLCHTSFLMNTCLKALLILAVCAGLAACTTLPVNRLSVQQRSIVISDAADEDLVLAKARLEKSNDPAVNRITILHLSGSPYEMGFQHGRLLKGEVRQAVYQILSRASFFVSGAALDEVYDLMVPFIPLEEQQEMRGLAHGAGLPLQLIHRVHALPELSEYKGRKQFAHKLPGTSCSNLAAFGKATGGRGVLQLRVLDWNRSLGTQQWPVILVHRPDIGNASVTFSFAGFIGCVSGMNDQQMAFGEKGEASSSEETLEGIPFVFLFRKLMRQSNTLDEAIQLIEKARRTCAYSYVISSAKKGASDAALVFCDAKNFTVYRQNQWFMDPRNQKSYPGISQVVYNGADKEALYAAISDVHGRIDVQALKAISIRVARKSNIQNVIFNPTTLESWVNHAATTARDLEGRASNQKWFYFNFKTALSQ